MEVCIAKEAVPFSFHECAYLLNLDIRYKSREQEYRFKITFITSGSVQKSLVS